MKFESLSYYCYWKIVDKSQRVDERFSTNDKYESKNFYKRFVIDKKIKKFVIRYSYNEKSFLQTKKNDNQKMK